MPRSMMLKYTRHIVGVLAFFNFFSRESPHTPPHTRLVEYQNIFDKLLTVDITLLGTALMNLSFRRPSWQQCATLG